MKRNDYDDNNKILLYFGLAMMALIVFIVVLVYSENNVRKSSVNGFNKAKEQAMQRQGKDTIEESNTNDLSFEHKLTSDELDIWTLPPTGRKEEVVKENNDDIKKEVKEEEIEKKEIEVTVLENEEETNRFAPTDFKEEDGRLYLYKNGKKASRFGLEISWKQGNLNMKRIKNSGCDFVILHVGSRGYASGNVVVDESFQKNIDQALQAGLDVGVVFTSQAVNKDEAIEEADVALTAIRGYKLNLPVFIEIQNVEDDITRTDGLSVDKLTDVCSYFINEIKDSGYEAGVYASREDLEDIILDELPESYIWLNERSEAPSGDLNISYWGYKEDTFNGIQNKAKYIMAFN